MPAAKGIRLWLRPPRDGHGALWIIRDGSRQKSTGCGPEQLREAEEILGAYIEERKQPSRPGKRNLDQIPAADVMALYGHEIAIKHSRPQETIRRLNNLTKFFGAYSLAEINKSLCRDYAKSRKKPQAARRELEDFRAAINHYFADETIQPKINIELPDKSDPKERWLTVEEAALLVRTAWRKTQPMPKGGKRYVSRHLARFILVGLYTGTRSAAICGAAIRPTIGRGYVDLKEGVFYRRPPGTKETTKRTPSIRLPEKLLGHLRRWERLGLCEKCVVEWEGEPVKRVAKGFRALVAESKLVGVTPHTLRHTSITWAMQRGTKRFDASEYFGVSEKVLEKVYAHHSPDHQKEVTSRMDRRAKR